MKQKNFFPFKVPVRGFAIMFGLVLIVLAVMRVVQTESFMKRAEPATGTVLESRQGVLIMNAVITVEFRDAEGVVRKAEFEPGGETTSIKKGDSLSLLYDPADKSYIYSGNPRLRRYPVSGLYFILGGCLIALAFYTRSEDIAGPEIST